MTPYIQVHTTLSRKEDAEKLARLALGERLAACVQICGPLLSLYHWQGGLENAEEFSLTFKTRQDLAQPLMELLQHEHPYDLPELIVTPVLEGSPAYLAWLEDELRPPVSRLA